MRKLYEIFKVLKVQKRIVSAETIRGNTVFLFMNYKIRFQVQYWVQDQLLQDEVHLPNQRMVEKDCHKQMMQFVALQPVIKFLWWLESPDWCKDTPYLMWPSPTNIKSTPKPTNWHLIAIARKISNLWGLIAIMYSELSHSMSFGSWPSANVAKFETLPP